MKRLTLMALVAFTFVIFQWGNALAFEYLDGKIKWRGNIQQILNMRTHEDVRDVRFTSFRTMFRLEGFYDIYRTTDSSLRLFTLANYYYDEGLDLDSSQRHAVRYEAGKDKYRDYRRPRNSEEWLSEFYLDFKYKTFQARIGKQLVSWGETAESRVADLINPLDMKYFISFPDWEDFKIGLWMARLYYTPINIWQDLSFELLVIPFDFEETRLPPAGTGFFFGVPQMPGGALQKIFDKQRRDAPNDGGRNLEIGFRIRGYSDIGEGVDWTISHFYTRRDTPIIAGRKGSNNLTRLFLGLPLDGKAYTYPHYNSTAATFSTTWDRIKSTIRGECVYNTNVDYQYSAIPQQGYKIKEKDLITTALTIDRATMVPWISAWNRNTSFTINFTWYQYWLLNHKYNKKTGEYIQWEAGDGMNRDSSWTKFTLSIMTGFWFYRILPIFNFSYDVNGNSAVVGALAFAPGDHWQWSVSYQQVNESGPGRYQNQMVFNARYEFW